MYKNYKISRRNVIDGASRKELLLAWDPLLFLLQNLNFLTKAQE